MVDVLLHMLLVYRCDHLIYVTNLVKYNDSQDDMVFHHHLAEPWNYMYTDRLDKPHSLDRRPLLEILICHLVHMVDQIVFVVHIHLLMILMMIFQQMHIPVDQRFHSHAYHWIMNPQYDLYAKNR